MPASSYPMHTVDHARSSLQQIMVGRDLGIISEEAYTILRHKIELRIRMLKKRELLGSAAKLRAVWS
jgi:hypothetical protein